MKILVVDDDKDFAESLGEILELKGVHVTLAFNGRDAIKKINENGFDALVLDLRMPVQNGWEVYKELHDTGHLLPIIIVTAYRDEEIATFENFDKQYIGGILSKPIDPVLLLKKVKCITKNLGGTGC